MENKNREQVNSTKIDIPVRHPKFDFSKSIVYKKTGVRMIAHFLDAMSVTFPVGEPFFIASVKYFEKEITNKELLEKVKQFYGQEVSHTAEHVTYNNMLERQGYNIEKLIHSFDNRKARLERQNFRFRRQRMLAITVALEYLIALMADELLNNPEVLDGFDDVHADIWRWHSIEEIEHKAVAFDVYNAIGGYYSERVTFLFIITLVLLFLVGKNFLYFLRKDKLLFNPKAWFFAFRYSFIKPGFFRKILPKYLRLYRPDYHPWNEDNSYLVKKWKAEYSYVDQT